MNFKLVAYSFNHSLFNHGLKKLWLLKTEFIINNSTLKKQNFTQKNMGKQ